jgi:hypothetical protein
VASKVIILNQCEEDRTVVMKAFLTFIPKPIFAVFVALLLASCGAGSDNKEAAGAEDEAPKSIESVVKDDKVVAGFFYLISQSE